MAAITPTLSTPAADHDHKVLKDEAFEPMPWTLAEIRAAIPARLFVRQTWKGLLYLARDIALAAACWKAATYIDPYFKSAQVTDVVGKVGGEVARWSAWGTYWWFQGLIFTGIWVIGHECGHSAFSANQFVNDVIGFVTHSFLWTPYFSWKISHHRHHSNHASMERDEVYVPKTRTDLGLKRNPTPLEYDELLGDTPIYTLFMLLRQEFLAFPAYLLFNVSGQKNYPAWTNHFDPNSILFTKEQWGRVMMSNFGIAAMIFGVQQSCRIWGASEVMKYYFIPWLLVSHWFIMITYLHHTDPMLPHYRGKEWNFQRGAAATVDRDFLGWQGRFFLHDVAHYHVIHHFFSKMPFYHGPEATKYLKEFIGDHYHRSSEPAFKALWNSYVQCQFVEDEGEVLFYRDRHGNYLRKPAERFLVDGE